MSNPLRTMQFASIQEAESFRVFLKMKDVKIAHINSQPITHVTVFTIITDQEWFNLLYRFGRWI